jgi:hypothetical protein
MSNSFTNRLYINSNDGQPLDDYYNKKRYELGTADVRCNPNQQLTLGLVKAVLPSTIGTFSTNPFVNTDFRRECYKLTNIVTRPTFLGFDKNIIDSNMTFYLSSADIADRQRVMIIFNPSKVYPDTINGYTVRTLPWGPKNTMIDMLGVMNSTLTPIGVDTDPVFKFQESYLKVGLYRLAITSTGASDVVIFPYLGTDPTVFRAIGGPIMRLDNANNPQNFYLVGGNSTLPHFANTTPEYVSHQMHNDPDLANVSSMINVLTNYTVDSFSSASNGVNNIIAQIPMEIYNLPTQQQVLGVTASVEVEGELPTTTLNTIEGSIVYQNANLEGGHKGIGVCCLNTFTTQLTDVLGQPLTLNGQNYVLEFEAKSSGSI